MKLSLVSRFIQVSLLLILLAVCGLAQADKPQAKADTDAKAGQILQRAIQAVGGDRYLAVHTLIGRGFFTDYKDGVPGIPTKFVAYIAYPDPERTEFTRPGPPLPLATDHANAPIHHRPPLPLMH